VFGDGVIDVDLRQLRGQSWHFTHTDYWKLPSKLFPLPSHVEQLRRALDLGGQLRKF